MAVYRLQNVTEDAERKVQLTRELLVNLMRGLALTLTREADLLHKEPGRLVNPLGVVQGRGLDVDRLCAVLCEQRDALKMLHYAAK